MSRVAGDDLAYAELCLHYGKENFLNHAEKICFACAAWDILQRLHRLKIKYALRIDLDEYLSFSEEDSRKYLKHRLIHAGELLDETKSFCDRYSTNPNYSAKNYFEISLLTDEAINNEITFSVEEELTDELDLLYGKIFSLVELAAENLFLATEISAEEKITLLEKVRDFYDASDYSAMYRSENFSDPERQYFYQTEIDKLKPKESSNGRIIIDATGVSLSDLAMDYELKGDFDKAIELYVRAYTQDEEPYDYVLPSAARVCRRAGYTEKAIEYLKLILEIDRDGEKRHTQNFIYTCHACSELIEIFFEEGRFDEAREFSQELIHYSEGAESSYKVTHLIVGWYNLYRLETEPQLKEKFWEKCLEKFKLLCGEEDLSEYLRGFLKTYAEKLPVNLESLKTLDALINRVEKSGEEKTNRAIFERAIEISDAPHFAEYHIKFLTGYCLYLSDESETLCKEAMSYCIEAEKFLAENEIRNDYLQSLIYYAEAQCMSRDDDFSYEQIKSARRKCNLILLTEKKTEQFNDAEKYAAWKEAADFYRSFDEHGGRLHCLKRAFELVDADNDFDNVWRLSCEMIECHISLGDAEEIFREVLALYKDLIKNYFTETKNLADKIKTLADYLGRSIAVEEFFALNFFAAYVALANDVDKKLILSPTMNSAEEENFFRAFRATLEENSDTAKVDFIADISENLKSSKKHFPPAEKYLALVGEFMYRHQFSEIEFKTK